MPFWLAAGDLARGHWSDYHRVFSRAAWSLWPLGKVLATAVLRWIEPHALVRVIADDTTAQHRGKHVYGKGCHHDAVRSSHRHTVWRWGHKWVVLSISVAFPFTSRRWALPVLAALYRPEAVNRLEGRRHKRPAQLARQLLAVLARWFPERRFVLLGDGGYASHELARFGHRHRGRVRLVSRFHGDANLYEPPPAVQRRTGRPRKKGRKLPLPQNVVAASRRTRATVTWYGGGTRRVELVSGLGQWYKSGAGLVPIRWVFVHDRDGTHRDEYFFTTDPSLQAAQIVSLYTLRWGIETTFQEMRTHLGFETPRQRTARSVLRTAPCLLGLFSIICLIYAQHARGHRVRPQASPWYAKGDVTFSDAVTTVRRLFWQETVFETSLNHETFSKLPPPMRRFLLDTLSRAA